MPLYDYTCKKCSQTFELLINSSTKAAVSALRQRPQLQQLDIRTERTGQERGHHGRAGRARAVREGHACNHRRANGKVVD
jgi:hypothetical protein